MYQVIDKSGQTFGPAPLETLKQWAIERRITPDMIVVDTLTTRQGPAAEMLLGMGVFLDPIPAGVDPTPVAPTQPVQPVYEAEPTQPAQPVIEPVSYTHKGSSKPGQAPFLQTRAVAFFIDFVFGLMVYVGLHALWNILFVRFETNTWTVLQYVDYLFIPAVGLYFLLRDVFFPGQSIGKRIANLKVVTTKGKTITPMNSITRNVAAAPLLFLAIPVLGYFALALALLAFIAECFMVLTQGKRVGDKLAMTTVVNA